VGIPIAAESGMKSRRLHSGAQTTWAVVLDQGDEVVATLTAFAREHRLDASQVTAIGAFSEATLGYFDRDKKDYRKIPVSEQVEVLSMIGDVALDGDQPKLHVHVVLGKSDGTTLGGHLIEGRVWPTLEVILTESPRHMRRRMDPASGLALIDLSASDEPPRAA
jgi:predicted DNA-binding protein with PD1-like motif